MQTIRKAVTSSLSAKTVACVAAVAAAVALPQIVHLWSGTAWGARLLPMHLPVLLVGLLAGAPVGALAGLAAPLCSFLLCGMPPAALLPFMMIELCAYGAIAGGLSRRSSYTLPVVLAAQLGGRIARGAVLLLAGAMAWTALPISLVWESVVEGLLGIALQLVLLPVLVRVVRAVSHA